RTLAIFARSMETGSPVSVRITITSARTPMSFPETLVPLVWSTMTARSRSASQIASATSARAGRGAQSAAAQRMIMAKKAWCVRGMSGDMDTVSRAAREPLSLLLIAGPSPAPARDDLVVDQIRRQHHVLHRRPELLFLTGRANDAVPEL